MRAQLSAQLPAQLRILSGCHAGACAPVGGGERLGAQDDCDFILSDWEASTPAFLCLTTAQEWALSRSAGPGEEGEAPDWLIAPQAWGQAASWGALSLTVCTPEMPWPEGAASSTACALSLPLSIAQGASTAPAASLPTLSTAPAPTSAPEPAPALAEDATEATTEAAPKSSARRWGPLLGLGAAGLALGLTWLWMGALVHPAARQAAAHPPALAAAPALDGAQQARDLQAVQQTLSKLAAGAYLQTQSLPDGAVAVSGWVQDVQALDAIAQALGALPRPPRLMVRTLSDWIDTLEGVAVPGAREEISRPPQWALLGPGRIGLRGGVRDATLAAQTLAQWQAQWPAGVVLVDERRVFSTQGPAVTQWLRQAGFDPAQALWQDNQMHIRVTATVAQQARLEGLLASPTSPLQGMAFVLQVHPPAALVASAAARPASPLPLRRAQLPFHISSVVGGPTPFVVLSDGTRLLVGADYQGWRLLGIEADHLIFQGARRGRVAVQR